MPSMAAAETEKLLQVRRDRPGSSKEVWDHVAVEEPLQILVAHGADGDRTVSSLLVTMRTPGHDLELAAGIMLTEGIVSGGEQIRELLVCDTAGPGPAKGNVVRVEVEPEVDLDLARLERHFHATSSCGVCGKTSLDALEVRGLPLASAGPVVDRALICRLPGRMRSEQPVFSRTGGLHAAALFDPNGALRCLREDVGRHNACDKVVGNQLLEGSGDLSGLVLVVSGRASFEIMQKALAAGIAIVVAIGAPTSLAVETARRFGMTLVGFTSEERFNVYAGAERIGEGC
jgi:FdhD protein